HEGVVLPADGSAPWTPGEPAGGQHDTLVRGSCGRELMLAAVSALPALSALRHRDSYV
ncbi:hypothetical protein JHN48_18270, partial [Streptomyces sp. MBT72]|nr:hypothetical protein [Streptomyces sp. MBT72]